MCVYSRQQRSHSRINRLSSSMGNVEMPGHGCVFLDRGWKLKYHQQNTEQGQELNPEPYQCVASAPTRKLADLSLKHPH